jgi:hypothetical protein
MPKFFSWSGMVMSNFHSMGLFNQLSADIEEEEETNLIIGKRERWFLMRFFCLALLKPLID